MPLSGCHRKNMLHGRLSGGSECSAALVVFPPILRVVLALLALLALGARLLALRLACHHTSFRLARAYLKDEESESEHEESDSEEEESDSEEEEEAEEVDSEDGEEDD